MIQSIYSSVSNADIVNNTKTVFTSDPIPLLRDKFLGEYRTELEKAKVRKNLGIPDENSLSWGNIEGFVEEQQDLVDYVESKWHYSTELNEDIENIQQAMDYALYFVTNFKGEHDAVIEIQSKIEDINESLVSIGESIDTNSENISELYDNIQTINDSITQLNEGLLNIDVDKNILSWIQASLENSKTISLTDNTLDIIVSKQQGNAIQILEHQEANPENNIEEILPGLYIKDLSEELKSNQESIETLQQQVDDNLQGLELLGKYTTELSDSTSVPVSVGGINSGTTVEQLKGKTISQILDSMLFPTTVRDLIYPSVYYTSIVNLVEVGSTIERPTLVFNRGDAGEETNRTDELKFGDLTVESNSYDNLGTYTYSGSVTYEAGEYLIDNKGNTTNKRIESGTKTASTIVTTTYPWYVGDTKQNLIKFDVQSGLQQFSVSGKAVIKLPGVNTNLTSFKVNGGLGYLDIDMNGWTESTESLNGITYKVWTKNDSYPSILPHQINFKLSL